MTKRDLTETELETLFDAARTSEPEPDAGFLARLEQDAIASAVPRRMIAKPGLFTRFRQVIGGWVGLGGLVAATVAGFWIGIAPPDGLDGAALFESSSESYADLLGDISESDFFIMEDG